MSNASKSAAVAPLKATAGAADPATDRRPTRVDNALTALRSYIERVERLEELKSAQTEDIKEVYGEAKANGLNPRIMRMCVRLRKMDKADRQEQDALLQTYMDCLD